jgi:NADH:ubiquinone oxidoreductase subunit 6 (subunit J)
VVQKLDLARQIIHAVELAFWILIGVIVFLIACMFAVWQQMKGSLRTLSIIFLIEGAIGTIVYSIVHQIVPGRLPLSDAPAAIQVWAPHFFNSLILPWGIYSITLLVLGIFLLVGSIMVGHRRNSEV